MGRLGNPDIIQLGMLNDFQGDSDSTGEAVVEEKKNTAAYSFIAGLVVGLISGYIFARSNR
jgi:hypothetical protein